MYFLFLFAIFFSSAVSSIQAAIGGNGGGSNRSFFCSVNRNPCMNGGRCVDAKTYPKLGRSYECHCPCANPGSHCEYCNSGNDPCTPNPCKGDCSCQASCKHALGYYCRSPTGYLGKNCTISPPTLRCDSSVITVTVPARFVQEYDAGIGNSYLALQPGLSTTTVCRYKRAQNGMYTITIPLPFNACGTMQSQRNGGTMVFKNQVWFNRELQNPNFDMPIPAVAFECVYQREYEVVTTIQPEQPSPPVITSSFRVSPTISLCKSQACPSSCPDHLQVQRGAIYTVGEQIHTTLTLDTGSHVTTLHDMYISCSGTPNDADSVPLVADGCASESGLPCKLTQNGASHVVCLSFQTPRSLTCNQIYIHARLSSCDRNTLMMCPRGATWGQRCTGLRRKREIEDEVAIGPFYIIKGSRGLSARMNVYPEHDLEFQTFDVDDFKNKSQKITSEDHDDVKEEIDNFKLFPSSERTNEDEPSEDLVEDVPMSLFITTFAVLLAIIVTGLVVICYMRFSSKRSNVVLLK